MKWLGLITFVAVVALLYPWFEDEDPDFTEDGIHIIPVPRGWSVEQAWEAISRGVFLHDDEPGWAVIEVENEQLVKWHNPETAT